MLVNLGTGAQNSQDWDRVLAGDFSRPPVTPDYKCVQAALALGDLAEPLGFDGIWFPEHHGTPYGMTPNPLQALTYFAGRTERVSLGTFVAVALFLLMAATWAMLRPPTVTARELGFRRAPRQASHGVSRM